jgi:hypothetical protein
MQEEQMHEPSIRMTQPDHPPSDSEIGAWIGKDAFKHWKNVTKLIEKYYPNVFTPEWLFGGRKHGWTLRFKKNKSFCTLIPEKNRFALLIVFGAKERAKVEAIRNGLSEHTQKEYDKATTYHDGKWLLLTIDTEKIIEDVMQLLAIKRKPNDGIV